MKAALTIEPLTRVTLSEALPVLLASPGVGKPADRRALATFDAYLREAGIAWEGLRAVRAGGVTALLLNLLLPGATAIAILPPIGEFGIRADDQVELLREGFRRLAPRNLYYIQALIEPRQPAQQAALEAAGLRYLTTLSYLDLDVRSAVAPGEPLPACEWIAVGRCGETALGRVLLQTYEGSLDCPELCGVRPIADVLAAHRAAGQFNPAHWELALLDGAPAGALLLARVPRTRSLEVVYMGVVPAARRRGLGRALLARAVSHARAAGCTELTIVVDDRNAPARALYDRAGFSPVTQREAYLSRVQRLEAARTAHAPGAPGARPV